VGSPCSFYCLTLLTLAFLGSYSWLPVPLDAAQSAPGAVGTYRDALIDLLAANISLALATGTPAATANILPEARAHATALVAGVPGAALPLPERGWLALAHDRSVFSSFDVGLWERVALVRMRDSLLRANGTPAAPTPASDAAPAEPEAPPPTDPALRKWIYHFMFPPKPTAAPAATVLTSVVKAPPTKQDTRLPWFRREYDLSRYGLDVVFDWSGST
jgi:hypothetical protein